jgi:uncharacterized protein DUF6582
MALTTKERDSLPEGEFAVPGKRALPIHDATHVKMAWKMVDRTQGLSDEERKSARAKILKKAHELGINTDDWNAQAFTLQAMAIELPNIKNHPNKVPFSGILTRLDEPSDAPLGGSYGKRVILPKEVAQDALASLLGMAIDFTPDLDGHDSQNKIGLITEANIEGNAIHINGFFYGADFPDEVKCIQANKASLGFSFEAQTRIKSMDDNPLVIDYCVFTGAAVLQKDKAAYTTTALAANSEKVMSDAIAKELRDKMDEMAKEIESLKLEAKKQEEKAKMSAGSIMHLVKPHSDALRACAGGMEAAGMGMNPKGGHVQHLRCMADHMDAEAAMGKMPHVYQTSDFYNASAKVDEKQEEKEDKEKKELKDVLEGLKTQISDLKKASFQAASEPERKTLPPSVMNLLAKTGIVPGDEKLSIHSVDDALTKANINRVKRIEIKTHLKAANLI